MTCTSRGGRTARSVATTGCSCDGSGVAGGGVFRFRSVAEGCVGWLCGRLSVEASAVGTTGFKAGCCSTKLASGADAAEGISSRSFSNTTPSANSRTASAITIRLRCRCSELSLSDDEGSAFTRSVPGTNMGDPRCCRRDVDALVCPENAAKSSGRKSVMSL